MTMISKFKWILSALAAVLFLMVSVASLSAQQPAVTITSPNRSAILNPGSKNNQTISILWKSQNVTGNVAIDLSRNGVNGQWETIIPNAANTGTATWTISGPATSLARFRVRTLSGKVASDFSDADIAIYGPYYKGYWYGGYCNEYAARGFDKVAPNPGID